ncbi:MAG: DUF1080 domain-containing protein [Gemmataceae bacterium]
MRASLLGGVFFWLATSAHAGAKDWRDLLGKDLPAFKGPTTGWEQVADVVLDPRNPRKLEAKDGSGVFYNGPKGAARNLFTKDKFGDIEVHLEFNIPKGSNSGIKFHGHYEIQIMDSFGKTKKLDGSDCGGIYPRALLKPRYHHIDEGVAPLVNACKEPGQWQTLDVVFLAPRFDKDGKKTANAKIVRARLNGKLIHDNRELLTPTGDRWQDPERAEGPIMLQADHGPVAFRNIRVRAPMK